MPTEIEKLKSANSENLWITRISAAAKLNGTSYSRFMGALAKSPIELDRKVLSDMAIHDPDAFHWFSQQSLASSSGPVTFVAIFFATIDC